MSRNKFCAHLAYHTINQKKYADSSNPHFNYYVLSEKTKTLPLGTLVHHLWESRFSAYSKIKKKKKKFQVP